MDIDLFLKYNVHLISILSLLDTSLFLNLSILEIVETLIEKGEYNSYT